MGEDYETCTSKIPLSFVIFLINSPLPFFFFFSFFFGKQLITLTAATSVRIVASITASQSNWTTVRHVRAVTDVLLAKRKRAQSWTVKGPRRWMASAAGSVNVSNALSKSV